MVLLDKNFICAWPFGILKGLHWFVPFIIIAVSFPTNSLYGSVGFVLYSSWNIFFVCLISYIVYLFGIHKIDIHFGGGFAFIPFALIDFIIALIGVLVYAVSSFICAIAVSTSIGYYGSRVMITFVIVTALSILSTASFAYFSILIYRSIPNGQFRYLFSMIIEGNKIISRNLPGPGGQSSTVPHI